jgi:hypothetical protein
MTDHKNHGAGGLANRLDCSFCNSVLMLCTKARESNRLLPSVEFINEGLRGEGSVVGSIGLDAHTIVECIPFVFHF